MKAARRFCFEPDDHRFAGLQALLDLEVCPVVQPGQNRRSAAARSGPSTRRLRQPSAATAPKAAAGTATMPFASA